MKCASSTCSADALALPEIQIPAMGYDFSAPISLTLALPLCGDCIGLLKLDPHAVIDAFGVRNTVDMMTAGKVPPDYSRARLVVRRLDAEQLAGFLARSAARLH